MDALLETITQSPKLAAYRDAIDRLLLVESQAKGRFRESLTGGEKAEFINGEVVLHSPANAKHLLTTGHIFGLLYHFTLKHRLGVVFSEKALIGLSRNDYEPDLCFFPTEVANGWAAGINVFPAPALIVEVLSPSTEARDRGVKWEDYADHGVQEYWIADPDKQVIEQYLLPEKSVRYDLNFKADTATLKSHVVAGFTVEVPALFDATMNQQALAALLQA